MKYIAIPQRPKTEWDWQDEPAPRTQTVICEDDGPERTGLFDASGTPLYRVRDRIRPGFVK